MYKIGEDEMVFCPYNRYHIVSKLRIQKHIIKCKKNYSDIKLVPCFYNYAHRLKPEDVLEHYEVCSHKTRLEGSRYYEHQNLTSTKSSVKTDHCTTNFPDINVKPRVFRHPDTSSYSSHTVEDVGHNLVSSDSNLEVEGRRMYALEFSGDGSDDDLEPLPLPKTTSKAFICVRQNPDLYTPPEPSQLKKFGRGKNFFTYSPTKPPRTNHLLPNLSTADVGIYKQNKEPFDKGNSASIPCSFLGTAADIKWRTLSKSSTASVTSSMLDDSTTLKSEEITFDENSSEENADSILKNFGKYVII